jgi:3-hydroxybutyryl-CoA dehydrogenase
VNEVERVSVVGAGTMGAGIATAAALGGYTVRLFDLAPDLLQRSHDRILTAIDEGVSRGRITAEAAERAGQGLHLTTSLAEAAEADLVIEAVPEKLGLKREIFAELDRLAAEATIFASNTSSLSINALAGATNRADRFLGLHFFNPAHIMKLVEVVIGDDTSPQTLARADAFLERIEKTAVHCKDTPAFIVNRVARPFYGEGLRLLSEGAAKVETIDALVRSLGFRMGPFELIDLVGCDVNLAVSQSVYDAYFQDPKYRPHPLQQRMVESGRLGRKSGRGFYSYPAEE